MMPAVAEAPARRRKVYDARKVALVTTAAPDGHAHCAVIDSEDGDGITSSAPDGHWHAVRGLEVVDKRGHGHELTETRCPDRHNASANHVRGSDGR